MEVQAGGYGHAFLASVQALPDRLSEFLRPISREDLDVRFEDFMEFDSLEECIEAGLCKMGMMPVGPGGIGGKKVGDLISGSLKRSKSYRSELAEKTYEEIVKLARGTGPLAKAAKQMKKLVDKSDRLLEKTGGKPR